MKEINCAICQNSNYKILYKPNFDIKKVDYNIFSARRLPDKIHYRIVKCKKCGLIYSNPIFEDEKINSLYQRSKLTYDEEIKQINDTYVKYFTKYINYIANRGSLLEVGCGPGFFLRQAQKMNFKEVFGIEPSLNAVKKADPLVKPFIIQGIIKKGIFDNKQFDVICNFQTIDHLINPNDFLQISHSLLKKEGIIIGINHNIKSWTARLLGEKCPMIDIEHIYLFDKKTIRKIYEKNGFEVIKVFGVKNNYSLSYWMKLSPLPLKFKLILLSFLKKTKLGRLKLNINFGNLGIIARKKTYVD